ncbi:hypothetical protein GQ600_3082 [Phytophthora cactorum]|nr:hypothetical protein GQ600_3082 [Phytophthora cactorum]
MEEEAEMEALMWLSHAFSHVEARPSESAWMALYKHGGDRNFLNATSLTRSYFHQLLERFSTFYQIRPVSGAGGRPPKLRYHHQALGLVLFFYVGSMEFILFFLVVFCVKVMQPSNADLQNAMYNGWHHGVYVTGTICFAADGCIIWSRRSCPGSWNDSDTSLGFRTKPLDPKYCPDPRMNVVSDSALPCSMEMTGRILTPLKDGGIDRILSSLRSSARTLDNAITSACQATEWGHGMHAESVQPPQPPAPLRP